MEFDVNVTVSIRVRSSDAAKASNHVLDLAEKHLADMLDSPAVVGTAIALTASNPDVKEVA